VNSINVWRFIQRRSRVIAILREYRQAVAGPATIHLPMSSRLRCHDRQRTPINSEVSGDDYLTNLCSRSGDLQRLRACGLFAAGQPSRLNCCTASSSQPPTDWQTALEVA